MRSSINMTWKNMPHHRTPKKSFFSGLESWIAFLSQHAMTKSHVVKNI